MGGVVGKIVTTIVNPLKKHIKPLREFEDKIFDKITEFENDLPLGEYLNKVNEPLEEVYAFINNVAEGIDKQSLGVIKGVVTGDWTLFRDSFVGLLTSAIYIIAIVVGIYTLNFVLIAAAVVALDAQHNQGALTLYSVEISGKIEQKLLGTTIILDNIEVIVQSIILISSLYAGYMGGSVLLNSSSLLSGFSEISSIFNSSYYQTINGIYSIYEAYMQLEYANGLYDDLMNNYKNWLNAIEQKLEHFNTLWDVVYLDVDMLYAASAGGYLFNAAAGSEQYSISSINEQSAYLLGIDTKRDSEFDAYFTDSSEIDFSRINISDITAESIRAEI